MRLNFATLALAGLLLATTKSCVEPDSKELRYVTANGGARSGETLEVSLETEGEDGTANSSETWKLLDDTLTTATHTYSKAECHSPAPE
ncbi:MAG: hypothetical protein RIF32_14480 [Leptospirales bacterium]|jgi:uncharacterized protein YggU (UPF0235/DUF167 family)